jgi:hypothetical protein
VVQQNKWLEEILEKFEAVERNGFAVGGRGIA